MIVFDDDIKDFPYCDADISTGVCVKVVVVPLPN